MRTPARRAAAVLAAAAAGLAFSAPAPAAVPVPAAMDALGDSITRAFDSCLLLQDCPQGSWATGGRSDINSLAARLTAWRPGFTAYNDARSGAQMDELAGQAAKAVGHGVGFVTVLMGANDACTPTVGQMTPVATYRSELDAGLKVLRDGLPDARILVLSVPDIYQLFSIGRALPDARDRWSTYGICQSMLKDAASDAPADVTRRATVLQRVKDFNTQLAAGCAAINTAAFPDRCTYDGGAVFDTKFTLDLVSKIDYFHPSLPGQAALAQGAWERGIAFQAPRGPEPEPAPLVTADPPPAPLSAAPAVVSAPSRRALAASGGARSGSRLSTLWLGPADAALSGIDVRLGAGAKLHAPRGGRVGTATLVDARWRVLRRVALRPGHVAGGVLRLGGLPAGTAGARIELASAALSLSGCRTPGWSAEVRDAAGARTLVRATRAC